MRFSSSNGTSDGKAKYSMITRLLIKDIQPVYAASNYSRVYIWHADWQQFCEWNKECSILIGFLLNIYMRILVPWPRIYSIIHYPVLCWFEGLVVPIRVPSPEGCERKSPTARLRRHVIITALNEHTLDNRLHLFVRDQLAPGFRVKHLSSTWK